MNQKLRTIKICNIWNQMEIKFWCLEIVCLVSAEHIGIYCTVVNNILRLKLFSIQKRMSEIQSPQIETMHCNMFEEENSLERPSSSSSQWVEINSQLHNFCILNVRAKWKINWRFQKYFFEQFIFPIAITVWIIVL